MGLFRSLMGFFGVVFLAIFVANGRAEFPSPDKVYIIQNTMDGGVAKPRGFGEMCKQLSNLTCGFRISLPYEDQYKWTLTAPSNYSEGINIFSKRQEAGYVINDLSFDDYPPYCYLVYKDVNLVSHGTAGAYAIQSVRKGQCLTSRGSEVGTLLWQRCGDVGQGWTFIETE